MESSSASRFLSSAQQFINSYFTNGDNIRNISIPNATLSGNSLSKEYDGLLQNESSTRAPFTSSSFASGLSFNALFDNESFHNSTISDGSRLNTSCCNEDTTESASLPVMYRFTLYLSLIAFLTIAEAFLSVFMNSVLLWAIARVETSKLRAKRFIQNMTLSNIFLSLLVALDPYFISALHTRKPVTFLDICWLGFYVSTTTVFIFSQAVCVLGLACDRVYAVVKPLHYSTTGYNKLVRSLILVLPWFVGFAMWGLSMILALETLPKYQIPGIPTFCIHLLRGYLTLEESTLINTFLLLSNLLSFITYISIFGVIKFNKRAMQSLSNTPAKKTNLSLARTYFLVNVTTLVLYLPAPVFTILTRSDSFVSGNIDTATVAKFLLAFYMFNPCLDPIILMTRIRSIRQNLPIKVKPESQCETKQTDSR